MPSKNPIDHTPPQGREPDLSRLRRRVFAIENLEAMPHVVWRLLQAIADERTDARDLERHIESDPALASKVLRLANSVYYGLAEKATTIRRAIVVIGFQELELLALGAGLAQVYKPGAAESPIDGRELWRHSLAVSWVGRELARICRHPAPSEVMVGGLLHDLGKLVLAAHLGNEYGRVFKLVEQGLTYDEAEKKTGLSHEMIGFWLARRWGLPEVYEAIILNHHSPDPKTPHSETVRLVMLADVIVNRLGIGLVNESRPKDDPLMLDGTVLTEEDILAVMERSRMQIPTMLASWENGGPKERPA